MTYHGIVLNQTEVEAFCKTNGITLFALFGSILSDNFRPDSDVDVLVRFEENRTPGFFVMAALEMQLTEMIKRKVDLRTADELSRYFREEVLETCAVQYAA